MSSQPTAHNANGDTATVDRPRRPFQVPAGERKGPVKNSLSRATRPAMARMLMLPELNDLYERTVDEAPQAEFADRGLHVLGVRYSVSADDLGRIPKEGPLVVVCNHPFGGLEGLILLSLLKRVRPDAKLLANAFLGQIPDLKPDLFLVDPFGRRESIQHSVAGMRAATRWVGEGHALGVFPSGEVSHLKLRQRTVSDPPWHPSVGRMVQRSGAAVLPVFFQGRNSILFQLLGLLHPRLRTLLLPREMLAKKRMRVQVRVGHPIPPVRLRQFQDAVDLTSFLRARTYLLRPDRKPRPTFGAAAKQPDAPSHQPVADPIDPAILAAEISRLGEKQKLLTQGQFDVYFGTWEQLPQVMREVGRLREISFRAVGEGTGKSVDLDRFDPHYKHLLLWDRDTSQVAGAYRLGLVDEILADFGIDGLYTSTLFRFKRKLLEQISPAAELGRSFVTPEYQKSYGPLMLLWKGIGAFVVHHPRYRRLFGPVSISAEYSSMSKLLLSAFLQVNRYLPDMARLIKPRNPPARRKKRDFDPRSISTVAGSMNEVNDLVRDLEADGKPMPVLLRQYLKLNAMFLGFNVDPEFGDVLDGLMLVDLLKVDGPTMKRYLGPEGYASFLAFHGETS